MSDHDLLDLLSVAGPLEIYVRQQKRKALGPFTTPEDFSTRQAAYYILDQVAKQAQARATGHEPPRWVQPPKAAIQQAVARARQTYDESLADKDGLLVEKVYNDFALQVLLEIQRETGIDAVLDKAVSLIPTWGAR